MKQQGYYFMHHSPVARSNGATAVGAAAYNANQDLAHKQQRRTELGLAFRKVLNQAVVNDALKEALDERRVTALSQAESDMIEAGQMPDSLIERCEAQDVTLSKRCKLSAHQEGITLWDPDQKLRYLLRPEENTSDDRPSWQLYQQLGIVLSENATIDKLNRREWLIKDTDKEVRIKEFELKETDAETGKRKTVKRGLDIYADKWHRYARKGDIKEHWISVPDSASAEMKHVAAGTNPAPEMRAALWNAAETICVKRNGQPAYKFEVALLRDLTYAQNKQALQAFVEAHFVNRGYVADIAVHEVEASDRRANLHAHILISGHAIGKDGSFQRNKDSWWSHPCRVKEWRKGWEDALNDACDRHGVDVYVDHRSYAERGIEKTPGVHLGPQQANMEKKGIETALGEHNRDVEQDNAIREVTRYFEPEETGTDIAAIDQPLLASIREEATALSKLHREGQQAKAGSKSDSPMGTAQTSGSSALNLKHIDMEALSEAQLDAIQQASLHRNFTGRVRDSIRNVTATINRLRHDGRSRLDKAKDWTKSKVGDFFDRHATQTMQKMKNHYQRERGEIER